MKTSISQAKFFTFFIAFSFFLSGNVCNVAVAKTHAVKFDRNELKDPTAKFLVKTTKAIQAAQKQLNLSKNFTGDFARSLAHQRHAIQLFNSGLFQRAAYHSRMARQYAIASLKANKAATFAGFETSKEESVLFNNSSALLKDAELQNELVKQMKGKAFSDQAVLAENISDIAETRIK